MQYKQTTFGQGFFDAEAVARHIRGTIRFENLSYEAWAFSDNLLVQIVVAYLDHSDPRMNPSPIVSIFCFVHEVNVTSIRLFCEREEVGKRRVAFSWNEVTGVERADQDTIVVTFGQTRSYALPASIISDVDALWSLCDRELT